MTTDPNQIASSLSEAQRAMVLASEPGGWGRADTATGVELKGAQFNTARALERKGLGEYTYGSCFEDMYFNNQTGLEVRAIIERDSNAK